MASGTGTGGGGGGSAREIIAGKAKVQFGADPGPLQQDMEKIKGSFEKWNSGLKKIGELAGGFGLVSLAVAGLSEIREKVSFNISDPIREAVEEMERLKKAAKMKGDFRDEMLGSFADPAERIAQLTDAFQQSKDAARKWRQELSAAQQELARLKSIDSGEGSRLWLSRGFAGKAGGLEEQIKGLEELAKAEEERSEKINEDRHRAMNPSQDPAFLKRINEATEALRRQSDAWGLVGTAAQEAAFVAEGANDAMLEKFRQAAERLEEDQNWQGYRDFLNELDDANRFKGWDPNKVRITRMREDGKLTDQQEANLWGRLPNTNGTLPQIGLGVGIAAMLAKSVTDVGLGRASAAFSNVRGSFNASAANQMLGISDQAMQKQSELLAAIKENTARLNDSMKNLGKAQ